ncbi:unnamed protein product, partial [Musa hybrid cultivar]
SLSYVLGVPERKNRTQGNRERRAFHCFQSPYGMWPPTPVPVCPPTTAARRRRRRRRRRVKKESQLGLIWTRRHGEV